MPITKPAYDKLIFELSRPGRYAYSLPECDVPVADPAQLLPKGHLREKPAELPEVSEVDVIRHYSRLSQMNYGVDTHFYPLGSCTMKYNPLLNDEMAALPGFAGLHPATPAHLAQGALELIARMESALAEITGMDAVSLHPAAGAQGELTGLLLIRAYHRKRGENRHKVIIPDTAHGTNPASCTLAGFEVIVAKSSARGFIEASEVRRLLSDDVAAMMVTNPNTLGIFEPQIQEIAAALHERGALLYLDGANMNALIGLCRPGEIGADVCHLNLHKTFCIPHGGGGPGMGPICVAAHLTPFLPGHPLLPVGGPAAIGAVSAAPWGSAGILPIPYAYIAMMGAAGLKRATEIAILNANYVARRLDPHFPLLFRGKNGFVAHECIVDLRPLKTSAGIEVEDVAKRLIDYGFHAPTMSWPVVGTLMIEPTESESKEELERFCDAMISIREEAREIETGRADRARNVLKMAPHTAEAIASDSWDRPYGRERAAFPVASLREHKFWPAVARIDNAWGDRNLVCACPPVAAFLPDAKEGPSGR
jgi:glycine dehydrogenase